MRNFVKDNLKKKKKKRQAEQKTKTKKKNLLAKSGTHRV